MTAWQVALERHRDSRLSERHEVSYRFPALARRSDAHELVRVLLDVDELENPAGPWATAIVGGRQVLTVTQLDESEHPTGERR